MRVNLKRIKDKQNELLECNLFTTNLISELDDIRTFMSYHVYAVWDFMSLCKSLQRAIAPTNTPWLPTELNRSELARFINEIVLCEESDINIDGQSHISHFDLYLQAMLELKVDIIPIERFFKQVKQHGIIDSINYIVSPAKEFVQNTFDVILSNKPHCIAAAFAYGRETIIPDMFKKILLNIEQNNTSIYLPKFKYYLERHIEVDSETHGPMSEELISYFCKTPLEVYEAEECAINSIQARINYMNGIEKKILL